jgi:FixJ family two-component response regulator
MAGDRDRAREAGMNDFTLKPLNNDSLRETIERFLEKEAAKNFHEDFSVQSFLPRLNEIPPLSVGRTDGNTRSSQA